MRKTQHEKDVELAKAKAPKYGMYINGRDVQGLVKVLKEVNTVLTTVLNTEASEGTKQAAINLIQKSIPSISNLNISNNNISQ